ncbi:MAG TPA: RDD family protein [Mycobacterium sp.]|jgi:uncharacterized RDD family membrane protein YckC|nr:RDD family protein [Mycobacterium sp.]
MSTPGTGDNPRPYGERPGEGQPSYPPPPYGPPLPPPYGQPPGYPYAPGYGQPPYGQWPAAAYGYGYPSAPVPGGRTASMGARFGGLVLDTVILAVPVAIIGAFTGGYHSRHSCDAFGNCTRSYDFGTTWELDVIALLLGIVYSALLVGLQGQTVGHRAAGIRVVDLNTGRLIGPGRAALRWLVLSITGALCTLGYWSPFFDSTRRQGWHDKATNSVVIPTG